MRKLILFSAMLLAACSGPAGSLCSYVDPLIGTGGHGHTFPGATTPFGMVQLSPDTHSGDWDACSGYHYDDKTISGFSHTHLSGTGCADLCDVLFYPASSSSRIEELPAYDFSHKDEFASPGYYCVTLRESGIKAELTAAPHTGVHRYSFSEGEERIIAIDLAYSNTDVTVHESGFRQIDGNSIEGMRKTSAWVENRYTFFHATFSEEIESYTEISPLKAVVKFSPNVSEVIARVGLSSVSTENAKANAEAELPELDFDKARANAEEMWENALSKIRISGASREQSTIFYTALYHTMICPSDMSDLGGEYRLLDKVETGGEKFYSTISCWDTFRAWLPLYALTDRQFIGDIASSMLKMYDAFGELPIWPLGSGETGTMIGYHSIPYIVTAWFTGERDFDPQAALDAMVHSSNINKKGSESYVRHGYVPSNERNESVALTVEYAYDDWCIAKFAEAIGSEDVAQEYYRRALNYANVFDGSTMFLRGRNNDGSWAELKPFDSGRDYTEGTPWHYRFFAPHDNHGLQLLFGTREAFLAALDDLFTLQVENAEISVSDISGFKGQYAHGNEPSHNMAYIYSYMGQPWKTQKIVRELLDEMYTTRPDGLCGNEDCGQMSAWYILSSLGLYSACPASGEYVLTTPLFDEAEITLSDGNTLRIIANNPAKNRYIQSVSLNGETIDANFITYGQLMEGGELRFTLGPKPNLERGTLPEHQPYSLTKEDCPATPYTSANARLFEGTADIDLACNTPCTQIRYTMDGSEPCTESALYESPIRIEDDATIKAKAYDADGKASKTLTINATRAHYRPCAKPAKAESGTAWKYFEGTFSRTAQVLAAKSAAEGVMEQPSIEAAPAEDHFAYIFTGYIDIPVTGVWEFTTSSDDGSVLYIGDEKVVNNDGSHAFIAATGLVALEKGLQPYKIVYFEDYEGQGFEWGWKMPGEKEFRPIPKEALYR